MYVYIFIFIVYNYARGGKGASIIYGKERKKHMAISDAHKQATIRYASKTYKRVPLDLRHEDYTRLQEAATATSLSVNGYIKAAIAEKISRDSIRSAAHIADAEAPAAPATEPSGQKIKSHKAAAATPPELEAVDLQRLLTDARYQLDIMDIYGQEQTQRLLDQARSK